MYQNLNGLLIYEIRDIVSHEDSFHFLIQGDLLPLTRFVMRGA